MPITKQQRALMRAVETKDTLQVRALLRKGVKPDFDDASGRSPLEAAIDTGSLPIVKALVEGGADINRENTDEFDTPLDRARAQKQHRIASYLKNQGAMSFYDRSAFSHRYGAWAQDAWDDEEEAAPKARKPRARKAPAVVKAPATESAPKRVFTEENLKEVFNGKAWAGKPEEMLKLWQDVPEKLKKTFDFEAALAEAKRETLKQHAKRLKFGPPKPPPITPPSTPPSVPPAP